MGKPVLKIQKTKDQVKLIATGDLTVQHSKVFRDFLVENNSHQQEVNLEMNEATALDIAGIQLAYAWQKGIKSKGGNAMVSLPTNSNLLDLLEKSRITKMF